MKCGVYSGEWIPGCWGGVIHGKYRCTCYPRSYPDLEQEIVRLQMKILKLEDQLQSCRENAD